MPQMFSQFFVQIFALYKFFRKNLRKKRRKFSMDPICPPPLTEKIHEVEFETFPKVAYCSNIFDISLLNF